MLFETYQTSIDTFDNLLYAFILPPSLVMPECYCSMLFNDILGLMCLELRDIGVISVDGCMIL